MRLQLFVAFTALVMACGSDTHSGDQKVPIVYECPRSLSPRAIVEEDMTGKKITDKTISLTFDSGPSESTQALEQELAKVGVRATWFIMGLAAEGQDTTLDLLKNDGHLIGNRTNTDEDVTTLSAEALVESVTTTDAFIKDRMDPKKLYFRSPYGAWDKKSADALKASPMNKYIGPVGWEIGDGLAEGVGSDQECWDKEKTPAECAELVVKKIQEAKKGIVTLHDPPGFGAKTLEMAKAIVTAVKADGYKFVRLDELNLVPRSQTFEGDGPGGNDPGAGPTGGGTTGEGEEPGENPCAK